MKNWVRKNLNKKHVVWDGNRLYHYACRKIRRHKSDALSEAEPAVHTNIRRKRSRAWMSYCVDYAIEGILNMGYYTEKHMLIVHDPYRNAPLTAMCLFTTGDECTVRVSLKDEFGWKFTSDPSRKHRIPIFCLRAGQKNEVLLEVFHGEEKIHEETIYLLTDSLPGYLKHMVDVKIKKKESALSLIFVYGGDTRFPYAFDESGEIRYYLSEPPKAYGLFPMSSGRFLFLVHNVSAPAFANPHSVLACEMDLFGRTHREILVEDGIHHDGCEMTPGGNILTVSSSMEKYVEDAIIEIDRKTGQIVRKLCLADILSDHPYFDMFDWAHINTISYLEEERCILLCARNLHSVMKINWDTFELIWILCDPSFWTGTPYEKKLLCPLGKMEYSYQAHAAYMMGEKTEDGRDMLIVFDNHWQARRPISTFDGDKNSYVRIYAIDDRANTAELLQSYKSRKSKIRSNGIAVKDRVFAMSGYLNKPVSEFEGIISEYSRADGKVLNRYMTYNSFYRAYPFFADYKAYTEPMEAMSGRDYLLGIHGSLQTCKAPDLDCAKSMPLIRRRFYKKSTRKEIRKGIRGKNWKEEKPEYELKKDLGEIYSCLYDRILLVFNRDHVIEKIYFCGEEHNYVKDFSRTTQRSPHLFAESRYFLAVPIADLAADNYKICFQCRGELYKLGKKLTVKE
jgi:arylsulfate sulfotransferase